MKPVECPICGKEIAGSADAEGLFPFCSTRCRQIDFYRWATGRYAIVEPIGPDEHEGATRSQEESREFDRE